MCLDEAPQKNLVSLKRILVVASDLTEFLEAFYGVTLLHAAAGIFMAQAFLHSSRSSQLLRSSYNFVCKLSGNGLECTLLFSPI
jgi:hypothetical protein